MMLQGGHSVSHPASPQALSVFDEYRFFLITSAVVFLIVMAAALWAAVRRRPADEDAHAPERQRRAHRVIYGAVAITIAILCVALVYDLALARSLMHRDTNTRLSIRITGHQWWWDVEYEDPTPQNRVHSANEIHIPVGRRVALKLESADVIHSFWAPSLGPKKDLIPGQQNNELLIEASSPGVYRVQCAEFCGLQHAKMGLYVVAEDESEFRSWMDQQKAPSPPPSDALTSKGKQVFETGSCVMCHSIAGTNAYGTVGPELTHIATRHSLAAGSLPNTRENLARWITDPQLIKPGVLMPPNTLDPRDMQALLAYLATLR